MDLEVGEYYSIKWRRRSLFADEPGRVDKAKVVVRKIVPGPLGEQYYLAEPDGRTVYIDADSLISAKAIKPFDSKGNIKPTKKGRKFATTDENGDSHEAA